MGKSFSVGELENSQGSQSPPTTGHNLLVDGAKKGLAVLTANDDDGSAVSLLMEEKEKFAMQPGLA